MKIEKLHLDCASSAPSHHGSTQQWLFSNGKIIYRPSRLVPTQTDAGTQSACRCRCPTRWLCLCRCLCLCLCPCFAHAHTHAHYMEHNYLNRDLRVRVRVRLRLVVRPAAPRGPGRPPLQVRPPRLPGPILALAAARLPGRRSPTRSESEA